MSNKRSFIFRNLFWLIGGVCLFSTIIYLLDHNYITINILKQNQTNNTQTVSEGDIGKPQPSKAVNIKSSEEAKKPPVLKLNPTQANFNSNSVMLGFADLVEYVTPSIVNITAVRAQDPDSLMNDINPALKELLKQFIPQGTPIVPPKIPSGGSGFVIREDGFIVTNNHVVEGTQNIQVTFSDGTKYSATVYAQDPNTDLAILKIDAKKLRPLKLSNYDKVRVGDWVIAIGNPFGFESTVSAGIISAKGRQIGTTLTDFIQTDAAINKGNSGGPMINTAGEVVGINTAIYSTAAGGSIGIGFAIPSKTISKVVDQLIANKKVVRSWLGITYQSVSDKSLSTVFKLDKPMGVVVLSIVPKSPAEESGVLVGDIIYSLNDEIITDFRALPQKISDISPNTKVKFGVVRDGKKMVINVVLKEAPSPTFFNPATRNNPAPQDFSGPEVEVFDDLGLKIAQINDDIRNYFGIKEKSKGVAIVFVKSGSISQQKNLMPGYKIISVNSNVVSTAKDCAQAIRKYSSKGLLLLIENITGDRQFVSITAEELKTGLAY